MSTVVIIVCVVLLAFIGENPWILLIIIPGIAGACYFLFRETPEEKNDFEEEANLVFRRIEEAKKFSDENSWVIKKVDIMCFEDGNVAYAYMLVDDDWYKNISHVKKRLEEMRSDWDAVDDSEGNIWLRKIATFGKSRGYIKVLKQMINQKYPRWIVESFSSGNLQVRIRF